jgi:transposase-like protein
MACRKKPTGTDSDLNLASLSTLFVDDDKAREFLEAKRWPDGPTCPHCGSNKVYTLTPKPTSKRPVRPGVYKCGACRKQFTVRIGTIFEESKIPLCKWLMAIHLMTSSKKGISSHQISREAGITQKSAWFLCHRIREAMREEPMAGLLKGTVEVDETYVGARKPRIKGTSKPGHGTSKKPVMVLVERDGNARTMPIDGVDSANLINDPLKG